MRNPHSPNHNNIDFMFINISPKFSHIKSYLCFTMLQRINQNYPMYPAHCTNHKWNPNLIETPNVSEEQITRDVRFLGI
jgi:hypothetical protein